MSSLIYLTQESEVLLATDTLAVDNNNNPAFFCTKVTHVPHLRTLIAGTGISGFSNEWALQVSTRMNVRGIENLNYHTPSELRDLWKNYNKKFPELEDLTTTVYQFGISEESEKIVSFVYRSTSNFESEEQSYGIGVKPECEILEGDLITTIPIMMQNQRDLQQEYPPNERVCIGGEIIAYHLTKDCCRTFKISDFNDVHEHKKLIL